MDTVKFVRAFGRLCGSIACVDCPVNANKNGYDMTCKELRAAYPQKYVAIVEKWAEEHPAQTNKDKFLEIFAPPSSGKRVENCPFDCEDFPCHGCGWWDEECIEPDKH